MSFWDVVNEIFNIVLNVLGVGIISTLAAFVVILPYNYYNYVRKKDSMPKKTSTIIVVICFCLGLLWWGATEWYGDHRIGSWFECKNYQGELYYAHLYPDEDNIKNYKVVVELDREKGAYYPRKIYFNQRQYLEAYDYFDSMLVGEKFSFGDQRGVNWDLELTSERADKIPEYSNE